MLEPQCGPKWIAAQLTDTRLTPERLEGSNESLEQKHEEGHQGQAYKQAKSSEAMASSDSNGRQELKAPP